MNAATPQRRTQMRSTLNSPRSLVSLACLGALALAFAAACSRPDYSKHSASYKPGESPQSDTPRGTSLPRTSLPMPPVAASRSTSARFTEAEQARLVGSSWTTLDGRHARPADFAGRVLVLDFWATYCPPCREQTPHLIDLQRRYGPQGLQIVGLNVGGDEDRPKIADFAREFGISYPLGYPNEEMNQLYFADNTSIPQTYIFDRQGRLVQRFIGYDSSMPAELERIVQAALQP
jgi:thiol-disulfide isomerase/thioredoxin